MLKITDFLKSMSSTELITIPIRTEDGPKAI